MKEPTMTPEESAVIRAAESIYDAGSVAVPADRGYQLHIQERQWSLLHEVVTALRESRVLKKYVVNEHNDREVLERSTNIVVAFSQSRRGSEHIRDALNAFEGRRAG